jgi:hypothetical protein
MLLDEKPVRREEQWVEELMKDGIDETRMMKHGDGMESKCDTWIRVSATTRIRDQCRTEG